MEIIPKLSSNTFLICLTVDIKWTYDELHVNRIWLDAFISTS